MHPGIRSFILAGTGFIERYLLSAAYFGLAYQQGLHLQTLAATWPLNGPVFSPHFAQTAHTLILVLVQLLIGTFLLNNRPPAAPPKRLSEVLVPLCSCAYFLLYSGVEHLPEFWRTSVLAGAIPPACLITGLALGLLGPLLSLWGVISLGKSFGIFVSARKPVLQGPYRYVRHPIYLGYFCIWVGLCLVNLSPAILLLVVGHILLFRVRSALEEACLAQASPEYADYLKRTGAFLPRWKREP